ncbi:MAG: hypothetical protein GWN62_26845 [Aliifodinibius sp.]|nr:hypothetical protein [Fodinibius sp.]
MTTQKSRPVSVYLPVALMAFQSISGLCGGIGLVLDPSGEALQMPITWLEGSPFNDYLIPGLILLIVLGFIPLIVLFGLWRQSHWSWFGALFVGVALLIWIGVEILIIGYHSQPPLQFIYGSVGVIILVFTLMPTVRKFYE